MRPLALGGIALLLLVAFTSLSGASPNRRCATGQALGFVAITADPLFLVGTIPSKFTADPIFFSRRYSCLGRKPEVRRVDLGFYDVRFPGLEGKVALSDAISPEAVSSSVQDIGNGIYRISLRGPLVGGEVMSRRDVAFSLVLY